MTTKLPSHLILFNDYMAASWHQDWRESRVNRSHVAISIYVGPTAHLTPIQLFTIKERWAESCGVSTDDVRIKVLPNDHLVIYDVNDVHSVAWNPGKQRVTWTFRA